MKKAKIKTIPMDWAKTTTGNNICYLISLTLYSHMASEKLNFGIGYYIMDFVYSGRKSKEQKGKGEQIAQ